MAMAGIRRGLGARCGISVPMTSVCGRVGFGRLGMAQIGYLHIGGLGDVDGLGRAVFLRRRITLGFFGCKPVALDFDDLGNAPPVFNFHGSLKPLHYLDPFDFLDTLNIANFHDLWQAVHHDNTVENLDGADNPVIDGMHEMGMEFFDIPVPVPAPLDIEHKTDLAAVDTTGDYFRTVKDKPVAVQHEKGLITVMKGKADFGGGLVEALLANINRIVGRGQIATEMGQLILSDAELDTERLNVDTDGSGLEGSETTGGIIHIGMDGGGIRLGMMETRSGVEIRLAGGSNRVQIGFGQRGPAIKLVGLGLHFRQDDTSLGNLHPQGFINSGCLYPAYKVIHHTLLLVSVNGHVRLVGAGGVKIVAGVVLGLLGKAQTPVGIVQSMAEAAIIIPNDNNRRRRQANANIHADLGLPDRGNGQ